MNFTLPGLFIGLLLFLSVSANLYQRQQNRQLKKQIARLKEDPITEFSTVLDNQSPVTNKTVSYKPDEEMTPKQLEDDLNQSIYLAEIETCHRNTVAAKKNTLLQDLIQSFNNCHKSLLPLLLHNIGWFIGILCFISGSMFFVAYTEGFVKSLTIFLTVFSYTLLFAWGGYHLQQRIKSAGFSSKALLSIGLLLIPLNFSAATRLLEHSQGATQNSVSGLSVMFSAIVLFYLCRLISGIMNRKLLKYFSSTYYLLSAIQLVIPILNFFPTAIAYWVLPTFIVTVLLAMLAYYIPPLLNQIFVEKKYLSLFSVAALIYTASISLSHILFSNTEQFITMLISGDYSLLIMLISASLFYLDEQLHDYKHTSRYMSVISFIAYAISFIALFLVLDLKPGFDLNRNTVMIMAIIIYARLAWVYRSLAPFYLMIIASLFLYFNLFISQISDYQWLFLSAWPLYALLLIPLHRYLRNIEIRLSVSLALTQHLFHFNTLSMLLMAISSQYLASNNFVLLVNPLLLLANLYYLLTRTRYDAIQHLSSLIYQFYCYLLLLMPVILVIISPVHLISIDLKMTIMVIISFYYMLGSHVNYLSVKITQQRVLQRELLINSSLLLSLILLVLAALEFSLTIKTAGLLFMISLNFLILSFSIYSLRSFYLFMAIISSAVVTFKLTITESASTGLLTISFAFFLLFLQALIKRLTEQDFYLQKEAIKLNRISNNRPDRILWCFKTRKNLTRQVNHKSQEQCYEYK